MIQDIIVWTIVFGTATYIVFKIIRSLRTKNAHHCDTCSGCPLKPVMQHRKKLE